MFRADSSVWLGYGHAMRCLTLAEELAGRGHSVAFACRRLPGDLGELIAAKGHRVFSFPEEAEEVSTGQGALMEWGGADWLVVDHYGWSAREEGAARARCGRLAVIDDVPDRPHDCDLLIDQNLSAELAGYRALTPAGCDLRLGPRYALLRPEFASVRTRRSYRAIQVRVFVNFGGSDPGNETLKTMKALGSCAGLRWRIDVVVGQSFADKETVRRLCEADRRFRYHCQVEHMAALMAQADLAIGGGGVSALERCAVGVPSVTVSIAQNQEPASHALAQAGAILYLGPSASVDEERIAGAVSGLLKEPARLRAMKRKATGLVDGRGTMRVADILERNGDHAGT